MAPDDSVRFTTISPTAPGQPLDPARDGIAFLLEGEQEPSGYGGLLPTPWAPVAWRRSPDAPAGWGTHPGHLAVKP